MLTAILAPAGMTPSEYTIYITFTLIFMALLFIAAIIAIIVVLFQKSNSDGIQGRSIESKLKKWAWITLIVIGVLAIVIYIVQVMLP